MHRSFKSTVVFTGMACLLCMRAPATRCATESGTQKSPAAASQNTQRTYALSVLFDGPWAFYKDVQNNRLLAIAPEVPGHPKASIRGQKPTADLEFGVYDLLSLPVTGLGTSPDPKDIAPVSTTAAQLAQILQTPSALKRYVVILPLPDDIVENLVDSAKVDVQYQPKTSETDYTTEILLSYALSTLDGVRVAGHENSGKVITPIPLGISNRFIHIRVGSDFINDACDTHAKVAFKDLSTFFGASWYADFPPYDPNCPKPLDEKEMISSGSAGKIQTKRSVMDRMSPEVMTKLVALRSYLVDTVGVDFIRHRLLNDVALISDYLSNASSEGPQEEETRRTLDAAMDLRGYLKSVTNEDEYRDQMRRNLAAILGHIENAGGKNCKAPMVWVTVT